MEEPGGPWARDSTGGRESADLPAQPHTAAGGWSHSDSGESCSNHQAPPPDIRKSFCLIFYRVSFCHIDPTLCLSSYGLPGQLLWPERYVPTGCQQER